jgi:hypothetical protein
MIIACPLGVGFDDGQDPQSLSKSQKIGFDWVCFERPVLQAKGQLALFRQIFYAREPQMNTDKHGLAG